MEILAKWLWNPFMSLFYLELGVLFLLLTGAVAWRRSLRVFQRTLTQKSRYAGGRDIPHTQAFFSALATGVGVGNLAGVATAIHLGGPGALFWMWVSALAGTSFRMTSTYLAIKHGPKEASNTLFATPMAYLERFLADPWRRSIPVFLASLILIKGVVTANLIQANAVAHALNNDFGVSSLFVAILLATGVGVVVIGGVRQIVRYSVAIAPWMLLGYLLTGLVILLAHPMRTMEAIGSVFHYAFRPYSIAGGIFGYTVLQTMQFGLSRGVFSHNSGMGIAPFLQGANHDHPARGAFMAAMIPLVDTLIFCSVTGLVILSVGSWQTWTGAFLAVSAFQSALGGVGKVLIIAALVVFAFTTIINWAYFSERCFEYLGGKNLLAYRWFFTCVTFCGPFFPVALLWSMGDVLIALILLTHLLPLTYILIRQLPTVMADLESPL